MSKREENTKIATSPESHSLLSPSAAARWLACGPSALLESAEPDSTSTAAELGTEAHDCAARRLNGMEGVARDAEMERHVSGYVRYVQEIYREARKADPLAMLAVETRLDLSPWIPGGYGTADAVVFANGTLHVIDFKYGEGVKVNTEGNPQLMAYGLGALSLYSGLCYDIDTVSLTIYQPRMDNISVHALPAGDLRAWGADVLRPGALRASKGGGELVKGPHCRFCRVKARCKAWHKGWEELQKLRGSHLAGDAEVAAVVRAWSELKKWAESVQAAAEAEALRGKRYEGLKLVESRGRTAIVDPDGLAASLVSNRAAKKADIYKTELRGITELKKLVGAKRWEELAAPYVAYQRGNQHLVPTEAPGEEVQPRKDVEEELNQYFNN